MITRRAVIYTGFKCNLKCVFCMYGIGNDAPSDVPKEWVDLSTVKERMYWASRNFGNEWADVTGGEPTIYPHIMELMQYSETIGTRCRIITNGQTLADNGIDLINAGAKDFLVSLHGAPEDHDRIVGRDGAFARAVAGIDAMKQDAILFGEGFEGGRRQWKFGTNTVLCKHNLNNLDVLVDELKRLEPRQINLINQECPPYSTQARHSDVAEAISAIVYDLPHARLRIRYMPFCIAPPHLRRYIVNYCQIPYDPYEWDFASWFNVERGAMHGIAQMGKMCGFAGRNEREYFYNTYGMKLAQGSGWVQTEKCKTCAARMICEGVHKTYLEKWGDDELNAIRGELMLHPEHFRDSEMSRIMARPAQAVTA